MWTALLLEVCDGVDQIHRRERCVVSYRSISAISVVLFEIFRWRVSDRTRHDTRISSEES